MIIRGAKHMHIWRSVLSHEIYFLEICGKLCLPRNQTQNISAFKNKVKRTNMHPRLCNGKDDCCPMGLVYTCTMYITQITVYDYCIIHLLHHNCNFCLVSSRVINAYILPVSSTLCCLCCMKIYMHAQHWAVNSEVYIYSVSYMPTHEAAGIRTQEFFPCWCP